MTKPAPVVNSVLAKAFENEPNPVEPLMEVHNESLPEFAWKIGTADVFKNGKRIAKLACGHYTMTKARMKSGCPRCGEMIRAGYDYDGFRNLDNPDLFSWPDDPLRPLNENTISD